MLPEPEKIINHEIKEELYSSLEHYDFSVNHDSAVVENLTSAVSVLRKIRNHMYTQGRHLIDNLAENELYDLLIDFGFSSEASECFLNGIYETLEIGDVITFEKLELIELKIIANSVVGQCMHERGLI